MNILHKLFSRPLCWATRARGWRDGPTVPRVKRPGFPNRLCQVAACSLVCFLCVDAAADPGVRIDWLQRFNRGWSSALLLDGFGNLYVAGSSDGYATLKYDSAGIPIWVRHYEGPDSISADVRAMTVDSAGNVYVTGSVDSWHVVNSIIGGDFATLKYDSNGNLLWASLYDGAQNLYDHASDIAVDGAGNVYVSGTSDNDCSFLPCFGGIYTTLKYDSDGMLQWERLYGPGAATALEVDAAGNVYVAGSSRDSGSYDYLTLKYDPEGDLLWQRYYDGPANSWEGARALALDTAGNVYVTGYSYGNSTQSDYATLKYDRDGTLLWEARYDSPASGNDYPAALYVDKAGNVYVTGESSSSSSSASADYLTVKYDPAGTLLWARPYDGPENSVDRGHALDVDSAGNVYVTGESNSSGFSLGADYLTIKYDPAGNLLWETRYNTGFNISDIAIGVRTDGAGNVYVSGQSAGDIVTIKYVPCNVTESGDADGDSVADDCDNCPADPNSDQTDADADGIGDACDNCPTDFDLDQTDGDLDGVGDPCDNCPADSNSNQDDNDGDTYGDACDNCPGIANPDQQITIALTGDVNVSGTLTSADIIYLVNFVFKGGQGPAPCEASGDVNCNAAVTSSDIIYMVVHIFKSGPPPCDACAVLEEARSCE